MSKKATYRFDDMMDNWLREQAKNKGISKNDILRSLINNAMETEIRNKPTGS